MVVKPMKTLELHYPMAHWIVFIILQILFAKRAVLQTEEYLTIIPRARVGYEMIDSQWGG